MFLCLPSNCKCLTTHVYPESADNGRVCCMYVEYDKMALRVNDALSMYLCFPGNCKVCNN